MTENSGLTEVTIDATTLTEGQTYEFTFESFDLAGGVYSTLMTETISIVIGSSQIVEEICPVTQFDFDAFSAEHANYFVLEAQLGIGWEVKSFKELYDLAIEAFKLLDTDRYPCTLLRTIFVNKHSFLGSNANAQTIELTSSLTDEAGVYTDSYLQFIMGELKC